jgi:hypothetical protein
MTVHSRRRQLHVAAEIKTLFSGGFEVVFAAEAKSGPNRPPATVFLVAAHRRFERA